MLKWDAWDRLVCAVIHLIGRHTDYQTVEYNVTTAAWSAGYSNYSEHWVSWNYYGPEDNYELSYLTLDGEKQKRMVFYVV